MWMRYGASFEGIGITPDVPVERRIKDIASRRDAVLDHVQVLTGVLR